MLCSSNSVARDRRKHRRALDAAERPPPPSYENVIEGSYRRVPRRRDTLIKSEKGGRNADTLKTFQQNRNRTDVSVNTLKRWQRILRRFFAVGSRQRRRLESGGSPNEDLGVLRRVKRSIGGRSSTEASDRTIARRRTRRTATLFRAATRDGAQSAGFVVPDRYVAAMIENQQAIQNSCR